MVGRFLAVILAVSLASIGPVRAATWPGAAPCDGSLQACIDATAAGGEVLVATSAAIDETLSVNKAFSLRAAPGFKPVLVAGRSIIGSINQAGTWALTVEGFELKRGFINITVSGGTRADIAIRRNAVRANEAGAAEISLYTGAATNVYYEISNNDLDHEWTVFDGALRAALQVLDGYATPSGFITQGRIADNRITARGSQAIGILVATRNRAARTDIHGNRVIDGHNGSIMLREGSFSAVDGGTLDASVTSNVVSGLVPGGRGADGIVVDLLDGAATLNIANNTVNDAFYGVNVYADDTVTVSGAIERNILANLLTAGITRTFSAGSLTDSRNLFYRNGSPSTGINANSINADPMFVRPNDDLRVRAGSPAIDVENPTAFATFLDTRGVPALDADGLRRFKRATAASVMLDVGAYEFGDDTVLQLVDNSQPAPDSLSIIDHVSLNNIATAYPQVTANWNPDGGAGIYNNHPVSVSYSVGDWYLRDEDLAAFTNGSRFNVWVPVDGPGKYRHTLSAGNTSGTATTLTQSGLNNHPEAIVLVARDSFDGTVTADFTSPFGVRYIAPNWQVVNLAGTSMTTFGGFHVYFQPPSANAFRHVTSAGNNSGNHSFIDHPLLDGNPCARLQVTRSADGAANAHSIGVYYATGVGQWAIFNQDLAAMPVNAQFHVVVDPRYVECASGVFANGFE